MSDSQIFEINSSESSSDSEGSVIEISSDSDTKDDPTESASELVFLDLSCNEVVENHTAPHASVEQLATISDQFVNALDTEDDDKVLNYANVTIRKRPRTNNEETQIHVEELSKSVQMNTVEAGIDKTKSFLESLDDKVPLENAHPESLKFRKQFRKHRNELIERLMALYNEKLFGNQLGNIQWIWSKWIGTCTGTYLPSLIRLNDTFLTSADRVRDVLLHEMCHAAVFIINKNRIEQHGELWQSWGQLAKQAFPEIPLIRQFHNYQITQKYKFKCTICRGSLLSNSKLKMDNIFCAHCHGPVELFRIKIKNGRRVTVALRKPGCFALFVKENYRLIKTGDITHVGVMKALSEKYSKLTVAQKQKYRQSFGLLN